MKMKRLLTILTLLISISVLGQTNTVAPDYAPIYFDQNIDTINNKWYPKLDSIGQFLSGNPEFELKVWAFGHPTEKDFNETVFNRADNVLNYLNNKYKIRTHENILTNSNNRGVVPREDDDYSEHEKAEKRKVEFIIAKKKEKN